MLLPAYSPLAGLKPVVLAQARYFSACARAKLECVSAYSRVASRVPEASASPALYGWCVFHQIPPPLGSHPTAGDVAQRPFGVAQVAPCAGGAVCVHEREPPPAVVVEPGLRVGFAIAGVGRIARPWTQAVVEIALGPGGEAPHRRQVVRARLGDRDRVDRLEQRHDVPDRGQGVAFAVSQACVVPVPVSVAETLLGPGDPGLRERQIPHLGRAQLRSRGGCRGRGGSTGGGRPTHAGGGR